METVAEAKRRCDIGKLLKTQHKMMEHRKRIEKLNEQAKLLGTVCLMLSNRSQLQHRLRSQHIPCQVAVSKRSRNSDRHARST